MNALPTYKEQVPKLTDNARQMSYGHMSKLVSKKYVNKVMDNIKTDHRYKQFD